jgi:hypothetical protein
VLLVSSSDVDVVVCFYTWIRHFSRDLLFVACQIILIADDLRFVRKYRAYLGSCGLSSPERGSSGRSKFQLSVLIRCLQ